MCDGAESIIDFSSASIVVSVIIVSAVPARYFLSALQANKQSIIQVDTNPFLSDSNVPSPYFVSDSGEQRWYLVEDTVQVASSYTGKTALLLVGPDELIQFSPIPEREGDSLICHYVGQKSKKVLDNNTLVFHYSSTIPVLYIRRHEVMVGLHHYILIRDGNILSVSLSELYEAIPVYGDSL